MYSKQCLVYAIANRFFYISNRIKITTFDIKNRYLGLIKTTKKITNKRNKMKEVLNFNENNP